MLNNKIIAVVIPAYNEEKQISIVIETMPDFVDRIIIVNDLSRDKTQEIVEGFLSSTHNYANLKIKKKGIKKTIHNDAEISLQEFNKKEIKFFPKSEVFNKNQGNDRIILINNLVNVGVGGSIARGYKWC